MSDINTIKRSLTAQAQSVAEMLLPAGKKEGHEWRAGSISGDAGQSLGVHLTGNKAGVWADFSTGETGDLLDLWCQSRSLTLSAALDEARKYLGVERPKAFREVKKTYKRPPKPPCRTPRERVRDYLREERNLSEAAISAYRIGEHGDEIIFPFLTPEGVLALATTRNAEEGGFFRPTSSDCEPILGGWQVIPDDAREVVITEGAFDAASWFDYGHPALTVPFGGGSGAKQQWIENEYEHMERFEVIYLALDNDEQGDLAAAEIAKRLGRHRCRRVTMPHKDANECLVAGVSKLEMDMALADASSLDPEGLRKASYFANAVDKLFWPDNEQPLGYYLPYQNSGLKMLFRPAELTLWTGHSGDGKSQILSDCIIDWVKQGSRVCLASLEMKGAQTMKRMCKQAGCVDRPPTKFIHQILKWLDIGLLLYDRVGKASVEGLLEVFDYAHAKYGCDQFVVDSLMRLGIAGDDYTGQELAVFRLVEWAIDRDVHLHLVAHARKAGGGEGRSSPAETQDVKGAMEIGANAFNILSIWRNRKREDEIEKEKSEEVRKTMIAEKALVVMNVAKQRNGDYEGKIGLWFDQTTYQYRSSAAPKGRSYISEIEAV